MSDYKGDFAEDATVTMTFNTFNSSGASVTITTLATTDVFVYKDGTVLADPDAGVTLDLNAGTGDGAHILKVDMNSDAQYVTGADYEVKFEGATVDGQTINVWVGEWSCQNRYMRGTDSAALATTLNTKVPNNLNTTATGNIGIDWANVENPTTALDLSGTDIQLVDTATTVTGGATETKQDAAQTDLDTITDTGVNTVSLSANAITATAINANAITNAKIANDAIGATEIANGAIDENTFAANAITATVMGPASVGSVQLGPNAITATVVATDAIDADALADDAITEIWAKAMSDLAQGAPAADASVLTAINYLYEAWRNKTTTTSSLITVMKDDGTTGLVKSSIADAAGTFTKDEFITGA